MLTLAGSASGSTFRARPVFWATPVKKTPAPPEGLSETSIGLWPGLAADVEAASGGAAIDWILLTETLRIRDRLAAVREVLTRDGPTVAGSMGQVRPHPLLAAEATLARAFVEGLTKLGLTSDVRSDELTVSRTGRLRPA